MRGHGLATYIVAAVLVHSAAALGAVAQGDCVAELDDFARVCAVVTKVEFEFPVLVFFAVLECDFGSERPARFGAEAVEWANLFVGQKLFHFSRIKRATAWNFADGEAAACTVFAGVRGAAVFAYAGVATVVFFHHAATFGAWCFECGVVTGDCVAVKLFGLLDDVLSHLSNFAHELGAAQLAVFHERELVFPAAREFGLGQLFYAQASQQGEQLKGLCSRNHLAAIADEVFLVQQTFDDGGACCGCAQAFFLHSFAELVVFNQLACAFHRTQQSGFAVASRWAGFQAFGIG